MAIKNHFFHLYQQNKKKGKKGGSDRLAILAKGSLELSNLLVLIKNIHHFAETSLLGLFTSLLLFDTVLIKSKSGSAIAFFIR